MQKAWQATKAFCKRADMLLLGLCVLCSLFGIVIIRSATLSYDDSSRFVFVQILSLTGTLRIHIILAHTLRTPFSPHSSIFLVRTLMILIPTEEITTISVSGFFCVIR